MAAEPLLAVQSVTWWSISEGLVMWSSDRVLQVIGHYVALEVQWESGNDVLVLI
jgi:hypothetical protein